MRLLATTLAIVALLGCAYAVTPSLPAARPPLWKFRTYADSIKWSCESNDNNVLYLTVEHLPIPGVTSKMFEWLYSQGGLAGSSVHPVDKQLYPNYLLMHPRDHAFHDESAGPLKMQKSQFRFLEYPLTGCKAQDSAAAPNVCPSQGPNPGFTTTTSPAVLALAEKINATSVPLDSGANNFELGVEGCNENDRCAYVVKTKHTWKDSKQGLRLTTVQQFGLDLGLAAKNINPKVVKTWAGNDDPLKKCQRVVLHFIEELGATEFWLPQAYKAADPNGVITASSITGDDAPARGRALLQAPAVPAAAAAPKQDRLTVVVTMEPASQKKGKGNYLQKVLRRSKDPSKHNLL